MNPCRCTADHGDPARIPRVVLTGGPGAGKTAVLELVRQQFCRHVVVVPESASVLFRGGFPRQPAAAVQRAAQRAIFHVQRELEAVAIAEDDAALFLCDRGTVDGAAYWPGPGTLYDAVGTTEAAELARYAAVIHMDVPEADNGYDRSNPLRIESAAEADAIDRRIAEAWARHPRVHAIASTPAFLAKATAVLDLIRSYLPACHCQRG